MYLTFSNNTRSYHESDHSIHFLGHDGVSEFAFRVDVDALCDRPMNTAGKAACLAAFDALRGRIYSVAREAHSHCRLLYYSLTATDFK